MEVKNEQVIELLLSRGLATQALDACLEEYAGLDVWILDQDKNITFVD